MTTRAATVAPDDPDDPAPENLVQLRGRLAAEPEYVELPSGDTLATFRVVVPRPPTDRVRVDTIDCVSAAARVHRALDRLTAGDVVAVSGCLRRRFYRTPGGAASRYAVDVAKISRAAGRRGGAAPGRTRVSA